jgi:hypothetical protein
VLIFSWIIVFLRSAGSMQVHGSQAAMAAAGAAVDAADMRTGPDASASDPVPVSS